MYQVDIGYDRFISMKIGDVNNLKLIRKQFEVNHWYELSIGEFLSFNMTLFLGF